MGYLGWSAFCRLSRGSVFCGLSLFAGWGGVGGSVFCGLFKEVGVLWVGYLGVLNTSMVFKWRKHQPTHKEAGTS